MRFVHVGSVVADLVAVVPAVPAPGGDVLASSMRATAGGGFNVMTAAARHGMPVAYAGPHGRGPFGDLVRAALAAEGITVLQEPRDVDTGVVVALVDATGERAFVTSPDAVLGVTAADLALVRVEPGDVVSVSGYGLLPAPGPLVAWVRAVPEGVMVVVDPGPLAPAAAPDALAAVLERADWLSANLAEAAEIARSADAAEPAEIAAALVARTGRGVVVRAGAAGCAVAARDVPATPVPGFAVAAVDTTGAGDAHTGVFVAALARGADPLTAARTANAAAALSVGRPGPATAPTRAELAAFLAPHRTSEP